jgi:hypothetical protein
MKLAFLEVGQGKGIESNHEIQRRFESKVKSRNTNSTIVRAPLSLPKSHLRPPRLEFLKAAAADLYSSTSMTSFSWLKPLRL